MIANPFNVDRTKIPSIVDFVNVIWDLRIKHENQVLDMTIELNCTDMKEYWYEFSSLSSLPKDLQEHYGIEFDEERILCQVLGVPVDFVDRSEVSPGAAFIWATHRASNVVSGYQLKKNSKGKYQAYEYGSGA